MGSIKSNHIYPERNKNTGWLSADETEHKIQFEYVNDRTPVIEYTLDLTNKKAPEKDTPGTSENQGVSTPGSHGSDATSVSNSPKTGDNTNIAIFVWHLQYQQDVWEL